MIYCSLCKKEINLKHLKNSFQITLGNIINGKFHGKKVLFYHIECLVSDEHVEKKAVLQIT